MTETSSGAGPWWESVPPGEPIELGFVRLDRVGSSGDFELSEGTALARRAEFHRAVEEIARAFDAMEPLGWQGDGVMIFVSEHGSRRPRSTETITGAAMRAGLLGIELLEHLAKSGFDMRIAAHCGRVPFERDSGKLASPDLDRCGHLERAAPAKSLAVTDDVLRSLPAKLRTRLQYLGTTLRDRTVAHVYPAAAAKRRDASKFVASAEDLEPRRAKLLAALDAPAVRRLRYVGLRLTRKEPPSLDLASVFTPLEVEVRRLQLADALLPIEAIERARKRTRDPKKGAPLHDVLSIAPWSLRRDLTSPQPFEVVFAKQRHLVVLGDPGSGKSTLLKWLALTAADGRSTCRARLGIDERLLPVLVSIGRLLEIRESLRRTDDATADPPTVLRSIARYLHASQTGLEEASIARLLETELDAGRCLVLLDGVDEVPAGQRDDAASWIEQFAALFPKSRFVVTSRILGFGPLDLPERGEVVLLPFGDEQVARYLRNWFTAYRTWESALDDEAAERDRPTAEGEAADLAKSLRSDSRLGALARNPFLLSALALVHRAEGQLPSHRVRVYEIVARALCETWSNARRLVAGARSASARLEYESEAVPVLGRLAYWLHVHHAAGAAPRSEVEARIASALVERSGVAAGVAEASAREFLRKAEDELQILVERGPGLVGFLHLTFQEFFAAAHLHATEQFGSVARRRWFDSRWEEVLLLGIGSLSILQGRPAAAEKLIGDLLTRWTVPRYAWITKRLHKNVLFAARCCVDAPNVAAKTVDEVIERLVPCLLDEEIEAFRRLALGVLPRLVGSRIGERAFDAVLAALTASNCAKQRARVAESLGALRDVRALTPLIRLIRSAEEASIRSAVAESLGAIGDTAALEALVGSLREDDDPRVRSSAARALGSLGDARALGPLLETLRNDKEVVVRFAAGAAVGTTRWERCAETLVAVHDAGKDWWVRFAATLGLVKAGDARAGEFLVRVSRDAIAPFARVAIVCLRIAFTQPGPIEPFVKALRESTSSDNRAMAATLLGASRDSRALELLLERLRREPDESVRGAITVALSFLKDARSVAPLLELLRNDENSSIRGHALDALGSLRDSRALEPVLAIFRSGTAADVRASAARALGELRDLRALGPLLEALDSEPETSVLNAVGDALVALSQRILGGTPTTVRPTPTPRRKERPRGRRTRKRSSRR